MAGSTAAQLPTNNDPTNQIRFNTPAGADAKRQQLINYIWSGGLPTSTLPIATTVALPNSSLFDLSTATYGSSVYGVAPAGRLEGDEARHQRDGDDYVVLSAEARHQHVARQ